MSRIIFLLALASWLGTSCAERETVPSDGRQRPKHIVLVVVDTLRADSLIDPEGLVDTPNIDLFAGEGIAYTQTFSHAPMTLPSHTSLFSSREPYATGVLNNGQKVSGDLPLFAEHLGRNDFDTLGVFALGTLFAAHGADTSLDRGFDEYHSPSPYVGDAKEIFAGLDERLDKVTGSNDARRFVFCHFADPHDPYNDRSAPPKSARMTFNGKELEPAITTSVMSSFNREVELVPGKNLLRLEADHEITLRALEIFADGKPIEYEKQNVRKPLKTIEVPFTAPAGEDHVRIKLWLSDHVVGENVPRRYLTEVEYSDEWFGRLTELLEERGILDDSLLVFTSDHGEAFGEHGHWAHVQNVHKEMIHVPLFFWTPERFRWMLDELPADGTSPVSHKDVVPTLLDLFELPGLPGQTGRSLAADDPGPFLHLAETHRPESRTNMLSLQDATRKLIYFADEDRFALFALDQDPLEKQDVFAQRGREVIEWQKELRKRHSQALEARSESGELSESELEVLRALGYLGDE